MDHCGIVVYYEEQYLLGRVLNMNQKREWTEPQLVELHINQTLTGTVPIAYESVPVTGTFGTVFGNVPPPQGS